MYYLNYIQLSSFTLNLIFKKLNYLIISQTHLSLQLFTALHITTTTATITATTKALHHFYNPPNRHNDLYTFHYYSYLEESDSFELIS